MTKKPVFHRYLYLTLGIAGIVILTVSVFISNKRFVEFDNEFNRIYRLIAHSEIELSNLETEVHNHELSLREIEKELTTAVDNKNHAANLNEQIKLLRSDLVVLTNEIESKQELTSSLDIVRSGVISQFKFVYWMNTIIFVAGLSLSVFGFLALALHLEFFQDRRKKKREETD